MSASIDLESVAIQRFHQRWRDKTKRSSRCGEMSGVYSEAAAVSWIIRDALRLAADTRSRPIAELEPTIRRMVSEHEFVQAADCPGEAGFRDALHERLVETLVEVLEDVRKLGQTTGAWSGRPAGAPMVG